MKLILFNYLNEYRSAPGRTGTSVFVRHLQAEKGGRRETAHFESALRVLLQRTAPAKNRHRTSYKKPNQGPQRPEQQLHHWVPAAQRTVLHALHRVGQPDLEPNPDAALFGHEKAKIGLLNRECGCLQRRQSLAMLRQVVLREPVPVGSPDRGNGQAGTVHPGKELRNIQFVLCLRVEAVLAIFEGEADGQTGIRELKRPTTSPLPRTTSTWCCMSDS